MMHSVLTIITCLPVFLRYFDMSPRRHVYSANIFSDSCHVSGSLRQSVIEPIILREVRTTKEKALPWRAFALYPICPL